MNKILLSTPKSLELNEDDASFSKITFFCENKKYHSFGTSPGYIYDESFYHFILADNFDILNCEYENIWRFKNVANFYILQS